MSPAPDLTAGPEGAPVAGAPADRAERGEGIAPAEPVRPGEMPPSVPGGPYPLAVESAWRLDGAVCHGSTGQGGVLGPAPRPVPSHPLADPDSAFALVALGISGVMSPYLDREGGPLDEALIRAFVEGFLASNGGVELALGWGQGAGQGAGQGQGQGLVARVEAVAGAGQFSVATWRYRWLHVAQSVG
jgi:hypothetical protein